MENIVVDGNNNIPRFCRKCGEKLHENSSFCHNCGTKTTLDSSIEEVHEPVTVISTPNHTEPIKKSKKKPAIIGSIVGVTLRTLFTSSSRETK